MKRLIQKHKNTAVGLIASAFLVGAMARWMMGQITSGELTEFSVAVAAATAVMTALLSKDGDYKNKAE